MSASLSGVVAHALTDDAADLRVLLLAHVNLFELLETLLLLLTHLLDLIIVEVLDAGKLACLVAHDLQLAGARRDDKGAVSLQVILELALKLSQLLMLCLLNKALACHGKVLPRLEVLLLSSELLKVFLDALNEILCDGSLGVSAMLANPNARLRVAQVELLEDLILGEHVGVLVATVCFLLLLCVAEEAPLLLLVLAVLLGDLEPTREPRSFL